MTNCERPACASGLPATLAFESHGDDTVVNYCAPCVALNITQNWFTASEVISLHKIVPARCTECAGTEIVHSFSCSHKR